MAALNERSLPSCPAPAGPAPGATRGPVRIASTSPTLGSMGAAAPTRVQPGPAGAGHEGSDLSFSAAITTTGARVWQHARLWVSAPGCLLAGRWAGRPPIRRRAWAEHLAASGALASSGDRLALLDRVGLELTRRVLRPSSARPVAWAPDRRHPAVAALPV